MRKKANTRMDNVQIENICDEFTLLFEDMEVVKASVALPEITDSTSKKIARINKFYSQALAWYKRYASNAVYREAVERYKRSVYEGWFFRPSEFSVSYSVANNEAGLLSIVRDISLSFGGSPDILRYADNWELKNGFPHYEIITDKQSIIRKCIEKAASGQYSWLFPNFRKAIRKNFNHENVFITPDGLSVFYEPLMIAAPQAGFVTFEGIKV